MTMSKANVDPAELRRFALDLKRFTQEIETLVGQMHSKMNGLEGSWRDQEQKKFSETFAQTTKALAHFVEAAGEHSAFLNKKAAAIEAYLRQR
jgi:WXG100 family type VII secretion target